MLAALQAKIEHFIWASALVVVAIGGVVVWGYVELHRPAQSGTTAVAQADSVAREVQAIVQADRVLASASGGAPALSAPAASVIREIPGMAGFSAGQVAQILAGLKAPTRTVIGASLVGQKPANTPTAPPGWTTAQTQAIYDADLSASQKAIATSHIAVTVSQQEVPPTRVGSIFTPDGSGLAFAVMRHKQLELNVGAILRASHLDPVIQPAWLIPHTEVSLGPFVGYDKHLLYGVAATVHF